MSGQTVTIAAPDVRAPRLVMRINGQDVAGCSNFTVVNNGYQSADTFTLHMSISALPAAYGWAFWSETDAIDVELLAYLDGRTQLSSLIRGLADKLSINPGERTITVSGRDYSSLLIDSKTSEKFADQTLAQIAATLAARHTLPGGGTLKVSTVTTTQKAGDFYKAGHASVTEEVSEWDLLQWLAEQEGLDVWVAGQTLYVQSPPGDDVPPLEIVYSAPTQDDPVSRANATGIELERVLTLSRDIQVIVKSWDHGHKKATTVTRRGTKVRRKGEKDTKQGLPAHTYVFRVPGLTQVQAEKFAESKLAELSRHERTLDLRELPAVPELSVRRKVRLSGTGTAFDQDYYISDITRRFGWEGATMELHCKNSSPRNQVNI